MASRPKAPMSAQLATPPLDDSAAESALAGAGWQSAHTQQFEATVPRTLAGNRLDQAAAALFSDYSRAKLSEWIKTGELRVNGKAARPRDSVAGGEVLVLKAELPAQSLDEAQDIALDILFQDDTLIVINKPAGLVVHPGAGNADKTLVNALLHFDPTLRTLPRAGIVHRLDKDTTGCLVIARTLPAHTALVAALAEREVGREYEAIVQGLPVSGGLVDVPVERSHQNRLKMAASESGKPALTHFRVHERFRAHALLRLKLETGRTHQIRVHMQYAGFPIAGDPLYAGRFRKPQGATDALLDALNRFKRQALHAFRLTLTHPSTGGTVTVTAPRPADFEALLAILDDDACEI
jgi:23S rRNA pseudouridine1911/1915/1917 synthase